MATTRKPATAAKKTAAKKTVRKAAPRAARTTAKPAAAAAAADPVETMQKAFAPFKKLAGGVTERLQSMNIAGGMTERLQNLKLSGAAGNIAESGRKDLEALMKANQKSYQGLQAVVKRQTEMLRDSITHWQGTVKDVPGSDPRESIAKLDEMGRAAFQRALDDIRELADMAAKSQAEAFEIVRERITHNVDEVKKLLKQPGK